MRDDPTTILTAWNDTAQFDRVTNEEEDCDDQSEDVVVVGAVADVRLVEGGVGVRVVQVEIAHMVQTGHQIVSGFLTEHQFQVVSQIE